MLKTTINRSILANDSQSNIINLKVPTQITFGVCYKFLKNIAACYKLGVVILRILKLLSIPFLKKMTFFYLICISAIPNVLLFFSQIIIFNMLA